MQNPEITIVVSFSFKLNNTKKENGMINPKNIELVEITTRWISVVASDGLISTLKGVLSGW